MAKRTYPNDYFAWYNDDRRVAVIAIDTTATTTNERVTEKFDTYQDADVTDGLRITYHSKYTPITNATSNLTGQLSTTHGVDTGLQTCLLYYVKARLFEDQGNLQQAQYFRQMYEKEVKRYPSRKSGVRFLSVPRI